MQSELDLIDIWRIRKPSMKSYTWSEKSPCVFCRLDYWLISNNLQDFVQSTNISPAIRTDHAAIDLSIGDIEKGDNGPGFWKFNCSLLDDENCVNEVKNNFQMWIAEGEKDLIFDPMLSTIQRLNQDRKEKLKLDYRMSLARPQGSLKTILVKTINLD